MYVLVYVLCICLLARAHACVWVRPLSQPPAAPTVGGEGEGGGCWGVHILHTLAPNYTA